MMPIRCDTAWEQKTKPRVTGRMALPPDHAGQIRRVLFRVMGLDGATLGDYEGTVESFEPRGNFRRATAEWPNDLAAPGTFHLLGIVYGKDGTELARVAPRLVSVGMNRGY
jgi:hypothetical protein